MFFCTLLRISVMRSVILLINPTFLKEMSTVVWLGPEFHILNAFPYVIFFSVVILCFFVLFCSISINVFQCFSYPLLLKSCKMKQILEYKYFLTTYRLLPSSQRSGNIIQ